MADVMRELERLRPVYETGVLRLLLRQNAMLYVSLLRSTFDPVSYTHLTLPTTSRV